MVIIHNLDEISAHHEKKLLILLMFLSCLALFWDKFPVKGNSKLTIRTAPPGHCSLCEKHLQGTMTDVDGTYSLSALPTDTLVFSMVGTVLQEIVVGTRWL